MQPLLLNQLIAGMFRYVKLSSFQKTAALAIPLEFLDLEQSNK